MKALYTPRVYSCVACVLHACDTFVRIIMNIHWKLHGVSQFAKRLFTKIPIYLSTENIIRVDYHQSCTYKDGNQPNIRTYAWIKIYK